MFFRLNRLKCLLIVAMVIGSLTVATTHSGAMELEMAAMGNCSLTAHCCDCNVPELPSFEEPLPFRSIWQTLPPPLFTIPPNQRLKFFHPPKPVVSFIA
ncbi:MAG: hypothetical protein ACE5ER_02790 [Nitrospinaceae bacterium]